MSYNIVTIEREYASGGKQIGQMVAEKLGVPCYSEQILQMAAQRCGTTPEYIEHLEETTTNSLLYSLHVIGRMPSADAGVTLTDELAIAESEVIRELAAKGSCVIIGRCGASVLRERADVLSAFIHADLDFRRTRALEEYGISPAEADDVLRRFDKRRSNYYKAYANKAWKDITGYHLMLDSGKLGLERCAETILSCMK